MILTFLFCDVGRVPKDSRDREQKNQTNNKCIHLVTPFILKGQSAYFSDECQKSLVDKKSHL
jgi:hypothetical protein